MFKNIFGKVQPPASIRKGVFVGDVFHLYDQAKKKINTITVTEIYVLGSTQNTIIAFQFHEERGTVSSEYKKFVNRVQEAEKMIKGK